MTEFDVVIATRNRPDALALSLPLLLKQHPRPQALIIADSSDDHDAVSVAAEQAAAGFEGRLIIEHVAKGAARQRMVGLNHVTAPVVLFPDDDSLFCPGATKAMMRVYESDRGQAIAAVCAAESLVAPVSADDRSWEAEPVHQKAKQRLQRFRHIERHYGFLNPCLTLGHALARPFPREEQREDVIPVEYMTGFRMSFRTDVIRAVGFETRFQGYSIFEDVDASFAAMAHGAVVAARDAKIYHHRFPGGRPNRRALSTMSLVNRAYVVAKHATPDRLGAETARRIRSQMQRYALIRTGALLARTRSADGRADLRGTVEALPSVRALLRTCPDELGPVYETIRDRLELH